MREKFAILAVIGFLILITYLWNLPATNVITREDIWSEKLRLMSLFDDVTDKEQSLLQKLKSIHKSCGEVCDTSIKGKQGKYYEEIHKNIDCPALFTNPNIDILSEFDAPPKRIPKYLFPEFTHGGRWQVWNDYRNDAVAVAESVRWTRELIENTRDLYRNGKLPGGYGYGAIQLISDHLDRYADPRGKTFLVIGSQSPWIEAILLEKGASHVTTFDYTTIQCDHPQVETITPDGLAKKYFDGIRYDGMVTYSSIEHSGLGRYGDMLNPWGDLIAMARSWCLIKPGGYGLVGVPAGPDVIGFNSHKIYGPWGFAQIFANWEVIYTETDFRKYNEKDCYFCYQPAHSLKRL